jgi:hypothetical protein
MENCERSPASRRKPKRILYATILAVRTRIPTAFLRPDDSEFIGYQVYLYPTSICIIHSNSYCM